MRSLRLVAGLEQSYGVTLRSPGLLLVEKSHRVTLKSPRLLLVVESHGVTLRSPRMFLMVESHRVTRRFPRKLLMVESHGVTGLEDLEVCDRRRRLRRVTPLLARLYIDEACLYEVSVVHGGPVVSQVEQVRLEVVEDGVNKHVGVRDHGLQGDIVSAAPSSLRRTLSLLTFASHMRQILILIENPPLLVLCQYAGHFPLPVLAHHQSPPALRLQGVGKGHRQFLSVSDELHVPTSPDDVVQTCTITLNNLQTDNLYSRILSLHLSLRPRNLFHLGEVSFCLYTAEDSEQRDMEELTDLTCGHAAGELQQTVVYLLVRLFRPISILHTPELLSNS